LVKITGRELKIGTIVKSGNISRTLYKNVIDNIGHMVNNGPKLKYRFWGIVGNGVTLITILILVMNKQLAHWVNTMVSL
jgi:hypothetical protein